MYLSDIEIIGFKSFASKIKLKFAGGLSAIVGPNGCGKTNIVDAVRWVLGEKKASTLRSDIMENVIFNGTKLRKPLGMAEVILTVENTKGILPSEYSEVTISRRLFRNGDSQYLLNKQPVRLKDITNLFMDTGIGPDTYSVIELKMIEQILSGRVDDRREMFEEAAGIKKYKSRRKEANAKLEVVKKDMERVEDILQEVRKNVNSLARQASKTKRYNQLFTSLKESEILVYKYDFNQFNNDIITSKSEITELAKNQNRYEIELNDNEIYLSKLRNQLHQTDSEFLTVSDMENNLAGQISNLNREIAVSNEKINSLNHSKSRIENEIVEINNDIIKNNETIEIEKIKFVELQNKKDSAESKKNEIRISKDNFAKLVVNAKKEVNVVYESVLSLQNRINSLNSIKKRNSDKKANLERKLITSSEEKFSFEKQVDDINDAIKDANQSKLDLETDFDNAEKDLQLATEEKNSLQAEIDSIKSKINDKKNVLGGRKASLDFLNSLVDNSESSKFLMNNNNWNIPIEKNLLGEIVGIDEEYGTAVTAALGDYAHSFVVDSKEEALSGIAALQNSKKGKTGFIVRSLIPEISIPETVITPNGAIVWISEIARVDEKIRFVLRGLLGKTALVDNLETAYSLIEQKLVDSAVTIAGELVHHTGLIKGGSFSKTEGMWVGKKEKISKLLIEISAIESELSNLKSDLNDKNQQISAIDIVGLTQQIKKIEFQKQEISKKINQLELKRDTLENNMVMIEETILRVQDELSEISDEDDKFNEEISEIEIELNERKLVYNDLSNEYHLKEKELRNLEENLKISEFDFIKINNEIKNCENEINRLVSNKNSLESKIKNKENEFNSIDSDRIQLNSGIDKATIRLDMLNSEIVNIKTKRELLSDEKNSLDEQYNKYSEAFTTKRKEFDKIKEMLHSKELKYNELELNLKIITDKALEQYQIDLATENIEFPDEFSSENAKIEIADTKSKLTALGNINFEALEEFETQSERLELYESQMKDLTESQITLTETINEINTNAERTFKETFDKIQINFKQLFKKLFGEEGEADIQLENDNMLESDILITAKPPNKRPHSIQMLSQGEKTLTAIALLFAIYLVKPSPFCILDEVDAPLDDSNVEKFINLIRDFAVETQFLIVTHNKKTMEAAETLYGVTMQEDGVSKVVSVKFDNSAVA